MSTPEMGRGFELSAEEVGGGTVLHVTGEIDLSTHERVSEELNGLASKGGPVVVDLAECEFVDSSGIRSLLIGQRSINEAGGSIALAGARPQVVRVLEVTGIGAAIPMHDGVDEALGALASD